MLDLLPLGLWHLGKPKNHFHTNTIQGLLFLQGRCQGIQAGSVQSSLPQDMGDFERDRNP